MGVAAAKQKPLCWAGPLFERKLYLEKYDAKEQTLLLLAHYQGVISNL